jgi:uncharacterized protein
MRAPPQRWRRLIRPLGTIAVLLLVVGSVRAAEPTFPPLSGRVVDGAGILSQQVHDQIGQMLAQHEQATSEQIVVATLKSLQGFSIEDFGYQLGRHWGIGQKGRDNGAILLVAPNEHKVRIEVGYGLEGRLTDAQSRIIIEQVILPAFRRGDFGAGVLAGTSAMLRVLGGEEPVAETAQVADTQPADNRLFLALFIPLWCLVFFGIWGVVLVSLWRHRHDPHRQGYGSVGWMSGSSGGSSDGGFSGGGGSFGGGGASGSW